MSADPCQQNLVFCNVPENSPRLKNSTEPARTISLFGYKRWKLFATALIITNLFFVTSLIIISTQLFLLGKNMDFLKNSIKIMNQTLNDDVEGGGVIPASKKEAMQKAQLVIKSPRLVYQTCQDYFDDGIMESGNYTIDPDLEGPITSFMVYCDFELGVIRLLHDSSFKQNIEHCSTKDCYHLGIRYANSMDEIEAVIRVSNSCEQRIQFDCYLSQLTTYGQWSDRNGERQTYFAGANFGKKTCQCGTAFPNQCFQLPSMENTNYCHCDQKDPMFRQDTGYITNMTALPIVSFHYGFMYSNLQKASITIGPLECKGKSQSMLNGKSCHSLKLLGEPSGYYILETADKRYSRPYARVSKCNMSLSASDPKFQINLGYIQLSKVDIIIDITQHHTVKEGNALPFDKKVQDPTNSFFLQNSTFVAPWRGNFTFTKYRFRPKYSYFVESNYMQLIGNGHKNYSINAIESFEISDNGTTKEFDQGEFVVIFGDPLLQDLGCTKSHPCRLTIVGEENVFT